VGDPSKPPILIVGCIHGTECAGMAITRALEHAHTKANLWIVPNLNPDGYARGIRQNGRGVDLNANILRLHPRVTIWYHQHMDLIWAYGPSSAAGRTYARVVGMRFYHHHWLRGTATNWQNHHLPDTSSFTVELPAGSLSPAQVRRHVRAVLRLGAA